MPQYQYIAQTVAGSIQRGSIRGISPSQVQRALAERECRLVGIEEVRDDASPASHWISSIGSTGIRSIRSVDIELMLQQLSVMLSSGLALAPSLRELSTHCPKRKMQRLCVELAESIEHGISFADAIDETHQFPAVVAQLVRVGEQAGELTPTLRRAAEFVEKRRRAKGNLLSALAYPVLVAVAAGSVAVYLVGWAIPKLATFLDAMGRQLPAMTQSLLDLSTTVRTHGPTSTAIFVVAMIALALAYRWPPGRYRIDQCLLRIPLVGHLLTMAATEQLSSSLSLLLQNGVLLQDALDTAATLQRNRYLAGETTRARDQISVGRDLASTLRGRGFGPLLSSMIAVGEKTGDLQPTLDHVSNFYAGRVETQLKRIEKLIEPAIIVVVGGIVGYVYIAFFMALMSAGGNFQ